METFRTEESGKSIAFVQSLSLWKLFSLGIATSVDALAVGISIALTGWNIWISAMIIGVVTFILSFIGVFTGKKLGERFQKNAGRLGGVVLVGIGVKILIEHLFFN